MNDKYFTPDISDIRVGYECDLNDNGWRHIKVSKHYLPRAIVKNINGLIRVPYLTKEQIEKEGWEYNINYEPVDLEFQELPLGFLKEYKNDTTEYFTYYFVKSKELWIEKIVNNAGMGYIFRGECKDINTFRYICKLLGI